jgi:hypothetical protein
MRAGFHRCFALRCDRAVPDRYLMWGPHWNRVPHELQTRIWRTYFNGVRHKKHPTPEYYEAIDEARKIVAEREGSLVA